MADNPPAPNSGPAPPLSPSGAASRLPSPTTTLRTTKKGGGKIVVMLSSVAKPPPAVTQTLTGVPPLAPSPPPSAVADPSPVASDPPPLPTKKVSPGITPLPALRPSSTTHVKLPPKTTVPPWNSLAGTSPAPPSGKDSTARLTAPPPLPAKWSEPVRTEGKKSGPHLIPPIKLNEPSPDDASADSIFPAGVASAEDPTPKNWKSPDPVEFNDPAAGRRPEVSDRPELGASKPGAEITSEAKENPAPLVAPPLRPPPLPPPVPKMAENIAAATPSLHIAPPMTEKAPEPNMEKLPQPHFPTEVRTEEAKLDAPQSPGVQKVPALISPEMPPAKPAKLPTPAVAKETVSPMKKSTPLIVSSSSPKTPGPKIAEARPGLRPAVLPRRSLLTPTEPPAEISETPPEIPLAVAANAGAVKSEAIATPPSEVILPALPSAQQAPLVEKVKTTAAVVPPVTPDGGPVSPKAKMPLPPTRAARAKKRRLGQAIIFWALLVPLTVALLIFGSLRFGRDTRVEGQVIPPQGMTLSNEVWIVTDFSSYAAGIAEDLAAERTPIMQEIQERQDHVQRAQADVASREERIRLIQQEVQASRDEIASLVKKSRDATQQVWDGEGARIDQEYASRLSGLQQAIADRAKSLNLKYQPDNTYQSPEVWANAYRLALYDVPATVDSVKEHQWLSDQMKQWRDFLKSLDDRKEQLREKAAQIKLAPASRITDLNARMDDLQQRSDATAAEEVPLKTELQQAQADLATAQAADSGLDDKYYKELFLLPQGSIFNNIRIPLATNGRFTWVDDDVFAEGEKEHRYWIFARATRADGRQYWALHHFSIARNQTVELIIEPGGFISTKAILRPNLSPEEQEQ